jgi:pyruvate dehydrogenase E2 component (dihydrolipoamide acetyltransferase)
MEFKLPELGENIESGDVTHVLVKVGDTVKKNQTLLELEAGKASMEIPSPTDGVLKALHVKAGDTVKAGQLVAEIEDGGQTTEDGDQKSEIKGQKSEVSGQTTEDGDQKPEIKGQTTEVCGQTTEDGDQKPEIKGQTLEVREQTTEDEGLELEKKPNPEAVNVPDPVKEVVLESATSHLPRATPDTKYPAVSAAPNVRKLARELGVNIHEVPASAPDGHIREEDVKAFTREGLKNGGSAAPQKAEPSVRVEKMSQVRKATMKHMAHCWATIPHVTQHDVADITNLEALRKRYAPRAEAAGAKLTMTAILIKVIASALKIHPKFNSSIDSEKEEILFKNFYNIGIAMDTPKGLLVPVIKDGDKKNFVALALELRALSERAKTGKLSVEDLSGGTFTFTNLGIIGGSFFTPIVNSPEVAILGSGRAYWEAGVDGGAKRFKLPLSLSYDHRIIDGADGARFLTWIVEAVEEPMLLSLEG